MIFRQTCDPRNSLSLSTPSLLSFSTIQLRFYPPPVFRFVHKTPWRPPGPSLHTFICSGWLPAASNLERLQCRERLRTPSRRLSKREKNRSRRVPATKPARSADGPTPQTHARSPVISEETTFKPSELESSEHELPSQRKSHLAGLCGPTPPRTHRCPTVRATKGHPNYQPPPVADDEEPPPYDLRPPPSPNALERVEAHPLPFFAPAPPDPSSPPLAPISGGRFMWSSGSRLQLEE